MKLYPAYCRLPVKRSTQVYSSARNCISGHYLSLIEVPYANAQAGKSVRRLSMVIVHM